MNPVNRVKPFLLVGAGVVLLAALPFLLTQGLLNASIQMLIAALFACAYALLSGQGGMLSFGHAAYFGVGSFATVHAMNAFGGAGLLPTPLLPLAGAACGLLVGLVAGWFATQRSGTYFAMITLAFAELVHSLAPHLKGLFGGEAGISSMRMPAWGLTFGSTTQVYYLTLAWVLVCIALLQLFTRTPVGRLTLGLRENKHRLRFLGYNVHLLGVMVFAISAMFSGVAGALQVVSNEAANYVVFDPGQSAAVVLNSYIGGVGALLGPALGAALMTFFGYAVSDLTQSWLLYQGVIFVLVMMFMPQGLSGLLANAGRWQARFGTAALLRLGLSGVLSVVLVAAGSVFVVEMLQRLFSLDYRAAARLGGAMPPVMFLGRSWQPLSVPSFLVPASLIAAGAVVGVLAMRYRASVERRPDRAPTPSQRSDALGTVSGTGTEGSAA